MKNLTVFSLLWVIVTLGLQAQETPAGPKVKWFFTPEVSGMLHNDHVGRTMGFQAGVSVARERLMLGFFYYGRSGPINPHIENWALPAGQTYKGQSSLALRADHAAFGLMVAPQFALANRKITVDVPVAFGQMGAGFFLVGDDRNTPDGRRVSEWENELLADGDAAFGLMAEGGVRVRFALPESTGMSAGVGLHYTRTFGWQTTVGGTDYYNVPRVSLFLLFGN